MSTLRSRYDRLAAVAYLVLLNNILVIVTCWFELRMGLYFFISAQPIAQPSFIV